MNAFNAMYGDDVVQIVRCDRDFDGHGGSGVTEVNDICYGFKSNYGRTEIKEIIQAAITAGFPKGSIGISEDATGFDDEEGFSFPVPECVGFFVNNSLISEEAEKEFKKSLDEIFNRKYAWLLKA